MKKLWVIILSLTMIISVGCNQEEVDSNLFTESVEKGKLAIADKEYKVASSMFTLALEEKENAEVSKLKEQCDLMIEIEDMVLKHEEIVSKFDDYTEEDFEIVGNELKALYNDYKKMIEICDNILTIDSELQIIRDIVKEGKSEFEKIVKQYELFLDEYDEIKKEEAKKEGNKQQAKKEVYKCVICEKDTTKYCIYDGCAPLCKDDGGYYCDCGEFHHTQELCPVYDY